MPLPVTSYRVTYFRAQITLHRENKLCVPGRERRQKIKGVSYEQKYQVALKEKAQVLHFAFGGICWFGFFFLKLWGQYKSGEEFSILLHQKWWLSCSSPEANSWW